MKVAKKKSQCAGQSSRRSIRSFIYHKEGVIFYLNAFLFFFIIHFF